MSAIRSNEVYSWGVGEYDPEYCCDGVGGASATGFEAVPGFEVGDDLFDLPSDLVDGPVVVLVGFWLGWSGWFLDGGWSCPSPTYPLSAVCRV